MMDVMSMYARATILGNTVFDGSMKLFLFFLFSFVRYTLQKLREFCSVR